MLKILTIFISLILGASQSQAFPTRPDPVETRGEICDQKNPDFSEFRYSEKIAYCKRNVDFKKRSEIYDSYKIPAECRHRFTVDHFIPLSIGGCNDDTNLWPEHKLVKATRPNLEIDLYNMIKEGSITQEKAIIIIVKEKMKAKFKSQAMISEDLMNNFCDVAESF